MKLIDKDKVVTEIEKRKQEAESNCGGYKSYDEHRCDACIVGFYEEFLEILNSIEVKEVGSIWNDARKTIPEDSSNQILCIKEDGLAVLTVGKIVNGTKKWAYLNDLVDTDSFNIEVEESDLNPIFEEMGVEPDSKIAMAFRNAFYKGVDNFLKRKENKL